jgi:hypothetical protein
VENILLQNYLRNSKAEEVDFGIDIYKGFFFFLVQKRLSLDLSSDEQD